MATLHLDPGIATTYAAIIARASTDRQGDTCDNQIAACKEWAKMLSSRSGERFVIREQHIFTDEGHSAWSESILDRPGVRSFVKAVERREVTCLFIKGLTRFNRDDAEGTMFFQALEGMGVRVLSLEENFDSRDKNGKVMEIFRVHSFIAGIDSDKKSVATKIGLREKARKGQWKGGIPPFGYQYNAETKKLEPIEGLKQVVQDAFELAAEGRGPSWIAHHFNETKKWQHVDPKLWSTTQIQRILTRRAYLGELVHGIHQYRHTRVLEKGQNGNLLFGGKKRKLELLPESEGLVVENAHEPIISQELFDKVQTILQSRKTNNLKKRQPPNSRYPLTGLLVCGHCGGPMIHHGRNPEKGYQYYTCANKIRKGKAVCDQENVRADHLHEMIFLALEEKLSEWRSDEAYWASVNVNQKNTANHTRRIAELEAKKEQAAANITRLLFSDSLTETVREMVTRQVDQEIKQIDQELERLRREMHDTTSEGQQIARLQRMMEELFRQGYGDLSRMSDQELRDLFRDWVSRVTLYNAPSTGLHRRKNVEVEWVWVNATKGLSH